MSERPTALYDDLALAPEPAFDVALRQQLEARLQDRHSRATPGVIDIEFDMPLSAGPEPSRPAERGRSRRAVFAIAAAIVASVAAGLIVDDLVVDDSIVPPALTVPAPIPAPTTIPVPSTTAATTTTEASFTSDDVVAIKALLWDTDVDIPGTGHTGTPRPARLDGATAAQLPACRQFAASVFESEQRPAATNDREFVNGSNSLRVLQYVVVLPTVEQAAAMLDGMQDPAFLAECVPAYRASVPTTCCEDLAYWTPVFGGDELEAPTINVDADDLWARRWKMGSWNGERGVAADGQQDMVSAAVRVGRIVTLIDVALTDSDGTQRASLGDFERIVQRMAVRAGEAQ